MCISKNVLKGVIFMMETILIGLVSGFLGACLYDFFKMLMNKKS